MDSDFQTIIKYMKAHWPSQVKPEWQVSMEEYPLLVKQVLLDFTKDKTKTRHLIRIAGLSGSGKTTQLLPAANAYCETHDLKPVLVAARTFVPYHPHYDEILKHYGEAKLRQMTDEFATIMLFLTIKPLISSGYDIILDVTLLDPKIETLLIDFLEKAKYTSLLLMIAASPAIAEKHLSSRPWRHTRETEQEFIRATLKAIKFYAEHYPDFPLILWNTYDSLPVYDGPIKDSLDIFKKYSAEDSIPPHNEEKLRKSKIEYLKQK